MMCMFQPEQEFEHAIPIYLRQFELQSRTMVKLVELKSDLWNNSEALNTEKKKDPQWRKPNKTKSYEE